MEILLPILLELIASEVWDKVKERYAKPDPTWADHAVRSLEPSLGRSLTQAEREGVARWLLRPDVFASLSASTTATLTDDISRVVNALELERHKQAARDAESRAQLQHMKHSHTRLVILGDPPKVVY